MPTTKITSDDILDGTIKAVDLNTGTVTDGQALVFDSGAAGGMKGSAVIAGSPHATAPSAASLTGGAATLSGQGASATVKGGAAAGTNQIGGDATVQSGKPTGAGGSTVSIAVTDNTNHALPRFQANLTGIGFFGSSPIAKPVPTTVDLVVAALANLGLIDSSSYVPLATTGQLIKVETFAASGTWTRPAGCTQCVVEVVGPGGGGGGCALGSVTPFAAGGGGAGGYARKWVTSPGTTETVTVGTGGAGGAAGANPGVAGSGPTSFGAHAVAGAGQGSAAGGAGFANVGGLPGAGTTGDLLLTGQQGGLGIRQVTTIIGGQGGLSFFGGGATKGVGGSAGTNGTLGGGGSGAADNGGSAQPGGNGGDGVVVVYSFT